MMNLNKIKCVILDFDGTMYSGADWSKESELFGRFLVENNYISECGTLEEKVSKLSEIYPNYHLIQQIFAYLHDNGIDDSSFRKFNNENICEIRSKDIVFLKPEIVDRLAKNYKIYIISDSAVPYLEFYLDYAGIDKTRFEKILSNEYNDAGYTKIPMMKKVLHETGANSDEVIMVGDSEKSDIVPAKLLGLQTCHVKHVSETEKILNRLIRIKNSKI